jgi:photosystem II stability/assembly factor-like uncharacterized protein
MRLRTVRRGLALLLFFALPAFAGSRWTINGPDGGTVNRLVFDPADPSIVYAAASNGLFRSSDGGLHWVPAAALLGTSILDVAVAKSDPRTAFAASPYGLYKTSDRGSSWRVVNTDGSFRLVVSAQNPDVVYDSSINGLVQSADGGITFVSCGSGLPSGVASALAVDPQNSSTVYAAYPAVNGVYKTVDGGVHWALMNVGLPARVFSLAVAPGDSATLYAGGGSTIFKSADGAASWVALDTGTNGTTASWLSISLNSPSIILAATNRGVLRSTDDGSSWSRAAGFPDVTASAVAVDPTNAATFLAAGFLRVYRTTDAGVTALVSDSGLSSFMTRSITTDPRDDAVVYAAGPVGLARSADHGRTWSLSTTLQFLTLIAVDANGSVIYAISDTVHRSADGGNTWSPFAAGLPEGTTPFFLAADPRVSGTLYTVVNGEVYRKVGDGAWIFRSSGLDPAMDFVTIDPQDSSTLYAGGPTGVFKSSNDGASWTAANTGLTGLNAIGLSVDPFDSRHLFAWSPTQVFESFDSAAHWTQLSAGPHGTRTFDPYLPGGVYAIEFDKVQRSTDGGKTWYPLTDGLPRSYSLFTVGAKGTPYLGGTSGGVFAFHFVRMRAVEK